MLDFFFFTPEAVKTSGMLDANAFGPATAMGIERSIWVSTACAPMSMCRAEG